MFRIIKFGKLIRNLVLITMVLSISSFVGLQKFFPEIDLFKLVTISTIIVGLIIYLILSPTISRFLWCIFSYINKSLYPDLNGTWEGIITLNNGNTISCRAIIRQALLYTQIDMHTETSKSTTLETTPDIEKGQFKLYYIYRSEPKNPSWGIYNGSTIFDIRKIKHGNKNLTIELSGKYYTSRETSGRISIKKVGKDINSEVSYY
jgi:hypothetical protein